MSSQRISRRDFLKVAGVSYGGLLFGGRLSSLLRPATGHAQMGEFMADAEISITAKEKWVQILSGSQTRVWSYEGQLLSGSGVTVQAVPGSYLGPIIRVKTGT